MPAARRNRGIGRQLMGGLLEALETDGVRRFTVSSANKNWEAIYPFYRSLGFAMWTITMYK